MNPFTKRIKRKILNQIETNNGAFYGDIVKQLDYPAHRVMKHLVDLKKQGLVFKDRGGQYKTIGTNSSN